MKCVVNWIPLTIRVRSRNTQPHLNDTLCVYISICMWIRAHIRSSTNKIEGRWLGTGREGRGTEAGKREGDRERVRERDIVWREGGRDSGRE